MRSMKPFILGIVTISLLLSFSSLGFSQPPEGKGPKQEAGKEPTGEKTLELYPPGEEPVPVDDGTPGAGISYGHRVDKEQVYEILSKELNVDKETIKKLEERTYADDHGFRNVAKYLILARLRTNMLIESGKYTKDQDKQAMQESIDHFFTSIHKAGLGRERGGWGDVAHEVGMTTHDLVHITKALFAGYWLDDVLIADLEKRGLNHQDALKIYIVARARADRIKESGIAPKGQEYELIKNGIEYFLEKKNKGASWKEIAKESGTNLKDLNMQIRFIELVGSKKYAE